MQGRILLLIIIAGIALSFSRLACAGCFSTSTPVCYSTSTPVCYSMSVPYGWYLEVNGGESKIVGSGYNGASSTSGVGGSFNLGYKFMPYFALEIGYTQYVTINIKDQFGIQAATIKNSSYDLTTKGIIPYPQASIELFAKLGLARAMATVSRSNSVAATNIGVGRSSNTTGVYMSIGAQYYFNSAFALVGQWARVQGNKTTGSMDLYSIGVSFIFDRPDP